MWKRWIPGAWDTGERPRPALQGDWGSLSGPLSRGPGHSRLCCLLWMPRRRCPVPRGRRPCGCPEVNGGKRLWCPCWAASGRWDSWTGEAVLELPGMTVERLPILPWLSFSGTSWARGRCTWCPELNLVMMMEVALAMSSMICPGPRVTAPGWAEWRWGAPDQRRSSGR